ncbi:TSUP family transporter [Chitinibacter sp. FCG-7]|uniref:Probable membrane transporter protein n=1 Tax=Chitinibacter mangrovi TaxID=3153927 RepID=A0AAU7F842_9NEIS
MLWLELGCVAFLAGVVDAVIGGGGLLQLPALFTLMPGTAPAVLLGTSKLSSIFGTAGAAVQYSRALRPPWRMIWPAILLAFIASLVGALLIAQIPAEPVRKILPFVFLALLIYCWRTSDGRQERQSTEVYARTARQRAGVGAAVIGFYDGLIGAGTGAFLKLLYVRGLGMSFLQAAAPAKLTNLASNLAAVLVFACAGSLSWSLGLWMALANLLGGVCGSQLALRFGNAFVRRAFLLLVSVLTLKSFWDVYV